jgi:hypothetical protein
LNWVIFMKKLAKDWQLYRWLFDTLKKIQNHGLYIKTISLNFSDNHGYEF